MKRPGVLQESGLCGERRRQVNTSHIGSVSGNRDWYLALARSCRSLSLATLPHSSEPPKKWKSTNRPKFYTQKALQPDGLDLENLQVDTKATLVSPRAAVNSADVHAETMVHRERATDVRLASRPAGTVCDTTYLLILSEIVRFRPLHTPENATVTDDPRTRPRLIGLI